MFDIRDKWVVLKYWQWKLVWLSFQKDNEVVEVGGAYRNFNAYSHKSSLRRPSIRLTGQCFDPRIGWTLVEAFLRSSGAQRSLHTAKPDSCREEMVISFSIRMMTKWSGVINMSHSLSLSFSIENDFGRQLEVSKRMSKQTYSKDYQLIIL
ncbi:hypothetical protein E1A91_D01G111500v1 [Gossypium mustelinum]|uniref:Uncharacterized protein n=1 Tax=Gossypium mustelinum TaxID=34275 RepID=A0A5D2W5S1_GOSMU|nr:hypothetical protein E1A91_D01G111500v1 [Gossypium mustelinum]